MITASRDACATRLRTWAVTRHLALRARPALDRDHALHRYFATHLPLAATELRTRRTPVRHDDLRTPTVAAHATDRGPSAMVSPLER